MSKKIFEPDFDMEAYIDKRLLQIEALKDKVIFKEVVGDLILELFQYTQNEYQNLEKRVLKEFQSQKSDYAIYFTLTDIEHYDATDSFMSPMKESDAEKKEIELESLWENVKNQEPYRLYTVYLEANAQKAREFENGEHRYKGTIRTDKKEYTALFFVKKNREYLDMIQELYHIFGTNYLPWMTVCNAYLHKMFDVYLELPEDSELYKNQKEVIQEIKVNFEEYQPAVKYHIVPLWNLTEFTEKTSTYPDPCIDKINYEHRIFAHRLDADSQYLICNTDIEITNIRRLQGDLIMTCPIKDPCNWRIYRINKKPEKLKYLYPVLSNQYKESFVGSINEMYQKSVKTKSEIARLIASFQYEEYVVFQDVKIQQKKLEKQKIQTYSMDDFMEDEIRIGAFQQTMILYFKESKEDYLNEDIMSFLVTQIQKLFPEYHCVGMFL